MHIGRLNLGMTAVESGKIRTSYRATYVTLFGETYVSSPSTESTANVVYVFPMTVILGKNSVRLFNRDDRTRSNPLGLVARLARSTLTL